MSGLRDRAGAEFTPDHGRAVKTKKSINELLASVGLTPADQYVDKFPNQLSGGQRERIAFARALAVQPDAVLADEPISMLDVSIRMGILNLMEQPQREFGISYFYIAHDLASARYFADDTIVMCAGQIVEGAGSEDLVTNPAHTYTQRLLTAVPNPNDPLRRSTYRCNSLRLDFIRGQFCFSDSSQGNLLNELSCDLDIGFALAEHNDHEWTF